jgi:hypothetical protein
MRAKIAINNAPAVEPALSRNIIATPARTPAIPPQNQVSCRRAAPLVAVSIAKLKVG